MGLVNEELERVDEQDLPEEQHGWNQLAAAQFALAHGETSEAARHLGLALDADPLLVDALVLLDRLAPDTTCERVRRWLDYAEQLPTGPAQDEALLHTGQLALKTDKTEEDEAQAVLDRVLDLRLNSERGGPPPGERWQKVGLAAVSQRVDRGRPMAASGPVAALAPYLDEDQRAGIWQTLARALDQAGQTHKALDAWQAVLVLRPAAVTPLCRLLDVLAAVGDSAGKTELLSRAVRHATSPRQRAVFWRIMADQREAEAGGTALAIHCWHQAWREADSGLEALNLKRLYGEQDDWAGYLAVLDREVVLSTDGDVRANLLAQRCQVLRGWAGDLPGAVDSQRRVLQLCPDDVMQLSRLAGLLEQQGDSARAAEVLLRLPDRGTTPRLAVQLILSLADWVWCHWPEGRVSFWLGRLVRYHGDEPLARLLQRALDGRSAPADPHSVLNALETLRRHAPNQAGALALAWARHAAESGDPQTVDPALRLARQCGAGLDAIEAVDASTPEQRQGIRPETDPDKLNNFNELYLDYQRLGLQHDDASTEAVVALLDRAATMAPTLTNTQLDRLELAQRSAGLTRARIDTLGLLLKRADSNGARQHLVKELWATHCSLQAPADQEARWLVERLRCDPDDIQAGWRLLQIQGDVRDARARVELLQAVPRPIRADAGGSSAPGSSELRRTAVTEAARLCHRSLDHDELAAELYHELLDSRPDHPEALDFFRDFLGSCGQHMGLVALLERGAEGAEDPRVAANLAREAAALARDALDDPALAIRLLQRAVEAAPDLDDIRHELMTALERDGQWEALGRRLALETCRQNDPETRVATQFRLAQLAVDRLHKPDEAARQLRAAMQLRPDDTTLLVQVQDICRSNGLWDILADALQMHAAVVDLPGRRHQLWLEAATVLAGADRRGDDALALLDRVLAAAPELPRFGVKHGLQPALELKTELLSRMGRWQDLEALLRQRLASDGLSDDRSVMHLKLGRVLLEYPEVEVKAWDHFEEALRHGGIRGPVMRTLGDLCTEPRRWQLLGGVLERLAADTELPANERASAMCEMGRLLLQREKAPELADRWYRQALTLDPFSTVALSSLAKLAEQASRPWEALHLGQRQAAAERQPRRKAALLAELGWVLLEDLRRPVPAGLVFAAALTAQPDNAKALRGAALLTFANGQWERAEQFTAALLEADPDLAEPHVHYYRLGFCHEKCGHHEEAFVAYVKSYTRDPRYLPSLDRLARLCFERRQWDNTVRVTETILEHHTGQKETGELADLWYWHGMSQLLMAQQHEAINQLQWWAFNGDVGSGRSSASSDAWDDAASAWASSPLEPRLFRQLPGKILRNVAKSLKNSLKQRPDHGWATMVLAAIAYQEQAWTAALRMVERASTSPDLAESRQTSLLLLAAEVAVARMDDRDKAGEYLRYALRLSPECKRATERLDELGLPLVPEEPEKKPTEQAAGAAGAEGPILLTRVKRATGRQRPPTGPMPAGRARIRRPARRPTGSIRVPTTTRRPSGSVQSPTTVSRRPTGPMQKPSQAERPPTGPMQKPPRAARRPTGSMQKPPRTAQRPTGPVQPPPRGIRRPTGPMRPPGKMARRPTGPIRPPRIVVAPPAPNQAPPAQAERPLVRPPPRQRVTTGRIPVVVQPHRRVGPPPGTAPADEPVIPLTRKKK